MTAPITAPPARASMSHEGEFVARVNNYRAEHGLAPLEVHSGLVAMARRWASVMAEDDHISHNPNLAAEGPEGWVRLGENVGVGATVENIHGAFVQSGSHRRNLLQSDFDYIGVGVATGRDGALFVTQNFMRLATEPAPAAPPVTPAAQAAPRARDTSPPPAPLVPHAPPRVQYVLEVLAEWDRGFVAPT